MRHAFITPTTLAERTTVPCRSPYDLLAPVRTLRKDLCLTPSDLAVLTALISFLPKDGWDKASHQAQLMTIVFPSNATLSERANGIDERTLRRSLGRLTASGLIKRKTSANGKRFPLRYNGVIRDAFGFDLHPLIEQHTRLTAQAAKTVENNERLRSLRTEALALRAAAINRDGLAQDELSSLQTMRNLLRRATLTVETVLRLISELRKYATDAKVGYGERTEAQSLTTSAEVHQRERRLPAIEPDDVSATNGQNDRHIKSTKLDIKNKPIGTEQHNHGKKNTTPSMHRDPKMMEWDEFQHIAEFFPEPPNTPKALTRIVAELGKSLRIRQERLIHWLNKVGPGRILLAFDYLIARAEVIKEPSAYFETILNS